MTPRPHWYEHNREVETLRWEADYYAQLDAEETSPVVVADLEPDDFDRFRQKDESWCGRSDW